MQVSRPYFVFCGPSYKSRVGPRTQSEHPSMLETKQDTKCLPRNSLRPRPSMERLRGAHARAWTRRLEGAHSVLTKCRVRTPVSKGNQIHSVTLWTLRFRKMYMATPGYKGNFLHCKYRAVQSFKSDTFPL